MLCRKQQHMLPQSPLFQHCSIQSQDVMQTWLHWTRQHVQLVQKDFLALFHPKPNECLHFDLESCNLMCTYTVETVGIVAAYAVVLCITLLNLNTCHIPLLAQARPMMLCIYLVITIIIIIIIIIIIGASVSEPHTSLFYCDFSHVIIYFLAYVVPYILNSVI